MCYIDAQTIGRYNGNYRTRVVDPSLSAFKSVAVRTRIDDEEQLATLHCIAFAEDKTIHITCDPRTDIDGFPGRDTAIKFIR